MTLPIKLTWASDTNYAAGVEAWSGTPTKVEPPTGTKEKGFIPETGMASQYPNWLLDQLTANSNQTFKTLALNFPYIGRGVGNIGDEYFTSTIINISDVGWKPDNQFGVTSKSWMLSYNSSAAFGGDYLSGIAQSPNGEGMVTNNGTSAALAGMWRSVTSHSDTTLADFKEYKFGYNRSRDSSVYFYEDENQSAGNTLRVIETSNTTVGEDSLIIGAVYDIGTRTVAVGYNGSNNRQASSTAPGTWALANLPAGFSHTTAWRVGSSGSLATLFNGDPAGSDLVGAYTTNGTVYTSYTPSTTFLNTGDILCDVCWSDYEAKFYAARYRAGPQTDFFSSTDGHTWTAVGTWSSTLATELAGVTDLPVSGIAAHGHMLLAVTGASGTAHQIEMGVSTDGGVTWSQVEGFPFLYKSTNTENLARCTRPIVRSNGAQILVASDIGVVGGMILQA